MEGKKKDYPPEGSTPNSNKTSKEGEEILDKGLGKKSETNEIFSNRKD